MRTACRAAACRECDYLKLPRPQILNFYLKEGFKYRKKDLLKLQNWELNWEIIKKKWDTYINQELLSAEQRQLATCYFERWFEQIFGCQAIDDFPIGRGGLLQ